MPYSINKTLPNASRAQSLPVHPCSHLSAHAMTEDVLSTCAYFACFNPYILLVSGYPMPETKPYRP